VIRSATLQNKSAIVSISQLLSFFITMSPSPSQSSPQPTPQTKFTSAENKLKQISDLIARLNWEPKSYIVNFLNAPSADSVLKRRFWGSTGWPGTRRLLDAIKRVVGKHDSGKALWEDYILDEVFRIIF
jgi:hypothetical protein